MTTVYLTLVFFGESPPTVRSHATRHEALAYARYRHEADRTDTVSVVEMDVDLDMSQASGILAAATVIKAVKA